MPELPEVETVARGLQKTILGRKILSVALGKTDFIDDPAALEQHLPGRRIEAVERYGKFMMLRRHLQLMLTSISNQVHLKIKTRK
jgi:formamidopyrimidine-DNA glycosylase